MNPYGQARRQPSNVLMLSMAAIMGAMIVVLATLVLQRHARPDIPRLALVCWDSRAIGESGDGLKRASLPTPKQQPALLCEGIQK